MISENSILNDRAEVAAQNTVRVIVVAMMIAALTAGLCAIGTATRPIGYLAGFWPANAITAAIFLRYPALSTPLNWAAAVAGFMIVDLSSGNDLVVAISLTTANFVGIVSASFLLRFMGKQVTALSGGMSVLAIFCASLLGAGVTSFVGSFASVAFFGVGYVEAFIFWLSNELINHVTLIPLVLAIPDAPLAHFQQKARRYLTQAWTETEFKLFLALALLVALCFISLLFSGQTAFVFPLPALILVAMLFSVFTTTVLVLAYAVWCQAVFFLDMISNGVSAIGPEDIMTVRFAITQLCLAPMAVAFISAARERMRVELDRMATRDDLTGILNRRAFIEAAEAHSGSKQAAGTKAAVWMLDIDHFKAINDRYGHAGGDDALRTFSKVVQANIRSHDVFGRLGGEEFAIVARVDSPTDAEAFANRIREAVKAHGVRTSNDQSFTMTVSIGGVVVTAGPKFNVEAALHGADMALYQAKHAGRDCVVVDTQNTGAA